MAQPPSRASEDGGAALPRRPAEERGDRPRPRHGRGASAQARRNGEGLQWVAHYSKGHRGWVFPSFCEVWVFSIHSFAGWFFDPFFWGMAFRSILLGGVFFNPFLWGMGFPSFCFGGGEWVFPCMFVLEGGDGCFHEGGNCLLLFYPF